MHAARTDDHGAKGGDLPREGEREGRHVLGALIFHDLGSILEFDWIGSTEDGGAPPLAEWSSTTYVSLLDSQSGRAGATWFCSRSTLPPSRSPVRKSRENPWFVRGKTLGCGVLGQGPGAISEARDALAAAAHVVRAGGAHASARADAPIRERGSEGPPRRGDSRPAPRVQPESRVSRTRSVCDLPRSSGT